MVGRKVGGRTVEDGSGEQRPQRNESNPAKFHVRTNPFCGCLRRRGVDHQGGETPGTPLFRATAVPRLQRLTPYYRNRFAFQDFGKFQGNPAPVTRSTALLLDVNGSAPICVQGATACR
jgi:hypothetical protein